MQPDFERESFMRIHFLQHVPFEGLGHIEAWTGKTGCLVTSTRLYEDPSFPELEDFDWLIVMGGPMSVHDGQRHPWLRHEKIFLKAAIDAGKSVLGICLGAQLIADVLGTNIYPADRKEIGWLPVSKAKQSTLGIFGMFPNTLEVFQWHGETFDLPHEAVPLFTSEVCENQAFVFRKKVIGLQFHLESTPESIRELATNCPEDLPAELTAETLTEDHGKFAAAHKIMDNLLNYMLSIA